MKKTKSTNPLNISIFVNYSPIIIIFMLTTCSYGLYTELKGHYILTIIFILFCVGILIYWYFWKNSTNGYYIQQARQVYADAPHILYASEIPKLFKINTFSPLPSQQISHLQYLEYQGVKRGFYHIYAIHLTEDNDRFPNPIIFLEFEAQRLSFNSKPFNNNRTKMASFIQTMIEEHQK